MVEMVSGESFLTLCFVEFYMIANVIKQMNKRI